MTIYHGSNCIINNPILLKSRLNTDFGKGFYTTTNFVQAERWSLLKKAREKSSRAIVTIFEVDDNLLNKKKYRTKFFPAPDKEWLDFVVNSRNGQQHDFEIIMGPVADDKVYATITLYESGVLSAEATVAQLKVNEYFNQISFHSDRALKELRRIKSEEIKDEKIS